MKKYTLRLWDTIKSKNFIINFFFGILLLFYMKVINSEIKMISAILNGGMDKVIDVNSARWYERSKFAMVVNIKFEVYAIFLSLILSSLLYKKSKKYAFLCILFMPAFCLWISQLLGDLF